MTTRPNPPKAARRGGRSSQHTTSATTNRYVEPAGRDRGSDYRAFDGPNSTRVIIDITPERFLITDVRN